MDPLLRQLRSTLPIELAGLAEDFIVKLEQGEYESILNSPEAKELLNRRNDGQTEETTVSSNWNDLIFDRLGTLLSDRSNPGRQYIYFCVGYAALLAFLQSNVTGPQLPFASAKLLLPEHVSSDRHRTKEAQQALLASLSVDGIAAYKLTPHIELLCLADAIFTNPAILKNIKSARWAKLRVTFMHQRLLSEPSSTLQKVIYEDIALVEEQLEATRGQAGNDDYAQGEFLLERSTIHIHHGLDKFARADIEKAATDRQFQFALTGLLGKRTKFQQKDTSQLVVLAKSAEKHELDAQARTGKRKAPAAPSEGLQNGTAVSTKPENLDLNDDTLLESIAFTETPSDSTKIHDSSSLPPALAELDPAAQPQLQPLDSSILLSLASSITNTSPQDGLTREETLPYATRVLEGGSSNWQVYTQALLVRSRCEGYKSRTVERGLLQLQALVDQVIADTTGTESASAGTDAEAAATSFLPRGKQSDSAHVTERLRYIFQLASSTRWDLEAELAARWVQLGGLRSALEIYERLELWAEAALCWAATEHEDKAKRIIRRQLFHATNGGSELEADEDETWEGAARNPAPLDAPRLYCILGDLDQSVEMFEKAWEVSGERYARAQRSLGRFYYSAQDFIKAAQAYNKSIKVNQLNHQSWFAMGCALLELTEFQKAAQAFSRCVQLDDQDAEAWSNLAAALLKADPETQIVENTEKVRLDDEEEDLQDAPAEDAQAATQRTRQDALSALKRAAALKHDSYRIWDNVLTVAASLLPPDYTTILSAQKRIVDLRGPTDGEKCIDIQIMQGLVNHIISTTDSYDPSQPGLIRMTVRFIDESITPLITASADLWRLVSKLALWRKRPLSALDAEEKAWRAVTTQPGWETESEKRWNDVVEATVRLCDSYESLGQMERTEGMGAGELVAKDWKFKARSAIRGIMGRGKDSWDGTEGWERLKEKVEELKNS